MTMLDDELRSLYQEVILDHYKHPRNFGEVDPASGTAEGYNPLCGDQVCVSLLMDGDVVKDVAFKGVGCAISTASASLMTEAVKGKTRDEATQLFEDFRRLMTGDAEPTGKLGKLEILSGVRDYPVRIKCAVLAWHALHSALMQGETVTTE